MAAGACSSSLPPLLPFGPRPVETACSTGSGRISFDFEAASMSRCVIHGEREFTVLLTPEHLPPINPSPWYAFRYNAKPGTDLKVHLRYLGGEHRYAPLWSDGKVTRPLPIEAGPDGNGATIVLPSGKGFVSAQELIDTAHYRRALARWSRGSLAERFTIGRSHDGRKIEAVRLGRGDAPRLVVLLGRQHPPEVTGAIAMEAFVDRISEMVAANHPFAVRYQFLIVPLLNPDGVARGNWRANLGGTDLNRDWGTFSQPESRAVKDWLDALPGGVSPVAMFDFHSTSRNLFYVQGEEASERELAFLESWLGGKEDAFPDYRFTIERRNANPGSGTTKNWFHQTYGIPAYTYEVGDNADRAGTRKAAEALASSLPAALMALEE